MRLFQEIAVAVQPLMHHSVRREFGRPIRRGRGCQQRSQDRVQCGRMRLPPRRGQVALIRRQMLLTHGLAVALPFPLADDGDVDPAIRGLVDAAGRDGGSSGAAIQVRAHHAHHLQTGAPLHQTGLDVAAERFVAAGVKGGGDGGEGENRRAHVDGDDRDTVRNAILADIFRHQPRIGLQHRIHCRALGQRPALAEAGDGHVEQSLLPGRDRVVAETQPVDHAGTEALQEHIGALDEAPDDFLASVAFQVHGDGALADIRGNRIGGVVAIDRAQASGPVAGVGRLHLDDIRAVLSQHHPAIRAGDPLAEINHLQTRVGRLIAHGFVSPIV